MPFDLIWERQGVLRRYHGDVTIAERNHSFDLIFGDARFDRIRYTITSYLDVSQYEIEPAATEEIAARHIGALLTNPYIAMAAVVVNPTIVAAIEHFMALRFVTQPYRIFATLPQAREWIAQRIGGPAAPPAG